MSTIVYINLIICYLISIFVLTCLIVFLVAVVLHRYLSSTYGYMGDAIRQNEIRPPGNSPIWVFDGLSRSPSSLEK